MCLTLMKNQLRAQRVKESQGSRHQSELFTLKLAGCLVLGKHGSMILATFSAFTVIILNGFEPSLLITFVFNISGNQVH